MSKIKLFIPLLTLFLVIACQSVRAQVVVEISKDITNIGGKEYYLHLVKQGQTLYSISEAYNVSISEIEALNPEVKNGLKTGHVLGIPMRQLKEEKPISGTNEEPKVEPKKEEPEPNIEPKVEPDEPRIEPNVEPKEEPIIVPRVEQVASSNKQSNYTFSRVVREGEDLYDLAKEFGIDIAELKRANPSLSDNPAVGTTVRIPAIVNENDYIVHTCITNERVSSLLRRWKVDEGTFRIMNVSVGSHVFVNQVVLIPIDPITDFYWMTQLSPNEESEVEEEIVEENIEKPTQVAPPQWIFDEETGEIPVCVASPENANKSYNVALMVPLYLQNIGDLEVSKDNISKVQKSRSLSFLQFYEGFVMAAEALEEKGLRLNLTVIDVTDNVSTAQNALTQIENKDLDLIVGPFFGKSFAIIEEYAKRKGIVMVNPLSTRVSIIEDSPNVVKVKPGDMGMVLSISNLVKNYYSNANVFIVSKEKEADTTFLNQLEHHLNTAVNGEVSVSGNEFLQFARNESERLEMGSRLVPTIDVEGQVYSTSDFENGNAQRVVLSNTVKRYSYSQIGKVKSQLSGVRDNVIIAYGDDNVFATQILNSLTKDADRFPITLICAPDWSKFEKLLVDNLLKMNAIYVSDFFVDYGSQEAKRFVLQFRRKYVTEPQQYAFEGYDVGYYFLNALMQYGNDDLVGCLHCYEAPLLHTKYRFYYKNYLRQGWEDGKENLYWNLYQYDKEQIKLVPIDSFKKKD